MLKTQTIFVLRSLLMDVFEKIKEILTDILDIEGDEITPETYVIR